MNEPTIIEKEFIIEGMSCAACSSAVERVTRKIDGVQQSDVNLTTNRMRIVFDQSKVPDDLIIAKVSKAGFACIQVESATNTESRATKVSNAHTIQQKTNENKSQKNELIAAWIFGGLLMYVSMGHMINLPLPPIFSMMNVPSNFALLQLLLTIPILYLGRGFFIRGSKALFHLNPTMDSLVAMGSAVAFVYSLGLTILIPFNPTHMNNLFYEASGIVLVFIMTGKYLESRSKEKTKGAITALMALTPDVAIFVHDFDLESETTAEKDCADIKVGDIVLVKSGERIPLDGIVLRGFGGVDESMLTGESLPIEKQEGSTVIGGSINGNGRLYVKITRIGEDTTLGKIIKFVEEAQGKKAPIAKIADQVSGVFVPGAMLIALIAGIVWAINGADISFILRVVTSILVIACPCALGLATPAAIMTGTGLGASNGILIRSGEALETTKHIDTVVLDKTGTVTEGKPSIKEVFLTQENSTDSPNNWTKEKLLTLTAAIEEASSHPLAHAFADISPYTTTTADSPDTESSIKERFTVVAFENVSGKGVLAKITHPDNEKNTLPVLIGSRRFMEENTVSTDAMNTIADKESLDGATLIYIAYDTQLLGLISIADRIKPSSKEAVENFKKMGLRVILLTGDNEAAAGHIAKSIGLDEVIAEVLPQDKAAVIQKLQAEGCKVMMVGDGINDAPALVQANVGAAIGNGSDIAIESGDIVLVKGDLRDASKAVKLSRLTIQNIKQNLFWAFCYNTIGIPLAAGVLYPFYEILLTPMFASFAMSLSSVCVVLNALRLRTKKL